MISSLSGQGRPAFSFAPSKPNANQIGAEIIPGALLLTIIGKRPDAATNALPMIAGKCADPANQIAPALTPHPVLLPQGEKERRGNGHTLLPLPSRERAGVRGL